MALTPREERRGWTATSVAWLVVRALASTAVITTVMLVLFALRRRDVPWSALGKVAWANRTLLVLVFFGVLLWDLWSRRARRLVAEGAVEREQG